MHPQVPLQRSSCALQLFSTAFTFFFLSLSLSLSSFEGDSKARVGVVLENGQRLVGEFSTNTSLWGVLKGLEAANGLNLCSLSQSSGLYRQPVLVFTGREVIIPSIEIVGNGKRTSLVF